jgi:hypothetical protein
MIDMLRIELEIIPSGESFKKFILGRLAAAQKNKLFKRMPA